MRPLNLVMMVISMYLVRYAVLVSFFSKNNLQLALSPEIFGGVVLSIILLAAGGNVINDIRDIEADKINKPGVNQVGENISIKNALTFYYTLTSAGLILGFGINFLLGFNWVSVVHVFIGLSLWLYSNRMNNMPLVGNALISTLIAILPWIVTLYDLPAVLMGIDQPDKTYFLMQNTPIKFGQFFTTILLVVLAYSLFSYVQNMARELSKDVIDLEGDRSVGYKTAPTSFGIPNTKKLIRLAYFLLLMLQFAFVFLLYNQLRTVNIAWVILVGLCLFVPVIISLRILSQANSRLHFITLSRWNKISQGIGLLTMFYFYFL